MTLSWALVTVKGYILGENDLAELFPRGLGFRPMGNSRNPRFGNDGRDRVRALLV